MKSKFYYQTFITTVLQTGYKRDKRKERGREGATCLLTWTTINGSFLTKYGQWTVPKLQNSDKNKLPRLPPFRRTAHDQPLEREKNLSTTLHPRPIFLQKVSDYPLTFYYATFFFLLLVLPHHFKIKRATLFQIV